MEYKSNDFIIRHGKGFDDEDFLLFWPITEWVIGFFVLGLFVIFRHLLIGMAIFIALFYLFQKLRSEERGSKFHFLWKYNLWKSKKGLLWAPPAHATRFDN